MHARHLPSFAQLMERDCRYVNLAAQQGSHISQDLSGVFRQVNDRNNLPVCVPAFIPVSLTGNY
jgi:hypothetical protein